MCFYHLQVKDRYLKGQVPKESQAETDMDYGVDTAVGISHRIF